MVVRERPEYLKGFLKKECCCTEIDRQLETLRAMPLNGGQSRIEAIEKSATVLSGQRGLLNFTMQQAQHGQQLSWNYSQRPSLNKPRWSGNLNSEVPLTLIRSLSRAR